MKNIFPASILIIIALASMAGLCNETMDQGLYVSLIQDPPVLASRDEITRLVRFAKEHDVSDIFIQVYRANQSWFRSGSADASPYEICVKNISDDPLQLLIKEAHGSGIRVHAWLNLLSLSINTEAPILKKYGPGILTRNLKEKTAIDDYKIDNQYFLEPGDTRVRAELSNIVRDVLLEYPGLDGIQFDYIRYPDKEPAYGYTDMNIERFKKATGNNHIDEDSLAWKEWKRKQVTELLNLLVRDTRSIRPHIKISVTGCASCIRAYHEAYQDWPYWLNSGLIDNVTFMSYTTDVARFKRYVAAAKKVTNDFTKVNIAIAAYEMQDMPGVFASEMEIARDSGAKGFVILHYESLLKEPGLVDFLKDKKDL